MTSLARRIQRIERLTPPTMAQLVRRLFDQTIDVKGLTDAQLDDAIAYLEHPVVKVKRRTRRPQETGA
jgi:hypothetical protein